MEKIAFLERKKCPFEHLDDHKDSELENFITATDFDGKTGDYSILYCPFCKIGLTNPFPSKDTLNLLYLNEESRNFDGQNSSIFDKLKNFLAERFFINLEKKFKRKFNKILDLGTGNGRYAISGKSIFSTSTVDAVDFSPSPPYLLKDNNEINYYFIEDFYKQNKKYDLILLRHVLEHVIDPVQFLENLRNHLDDNGILLIEVPNLKSGSARTFGKYYHGYYVPYHIFHYTRESLAFILEKTGFKCTMEKSEIPLMSNNLANMMGISSINNYLRMAGMFLYPLQLLIENIFNSSTVLLAYACKDAKS